MTRDLVANDILELRDALNVQGHSTTLLDRYQGGIDFSQGMKSPNGNAVRKDLRFPQVSGIGFGGGLFDKTSLEFIGRNAELQRGAHPRGSKHWAAACRVSARGACGACGACGELSA